MLNMIFVSDVRRHPVMNRLPKLYTCASQKKKVNIIWVAEVETLTLESQNAILGLLVLIPYFILLIHKASIHVRVPIILVEKSYHNFYCSFKRNC